MEAITIQRAGVALPDELPLLVTPPPG